jgi:LmbE family N-acetylglucosaminyl deacetylase
VLNVDLFRGRREPLRLLCLGAHSDDIEIGCGGTILKLIRSGVPLSVYWVVLGASGDRDGEAHESAGRFLAGASDKRIVVKGFKDGFFPYMGGEIKEFFEALKGEVSPDVIFCHCRHDLHQDHRTVCDLTWNTFRNHMILEYEIIKYDGDLGSPNLYSHVSREIAHAKAMNLLDVFKTQRKRAWFTEDSFLSIMRIRGLESNAPEGLAEGFYCRKAVLE